MIVTLRCCLPLRRNYQKLGGSEGKRFPNINQIVSCSHDATISGTCARLSQRTPNFATPRYVAKLSLQQKTNLLQITSTAIRLYTSIYYYHYLLGPINKPTHGETVNKINVFLKKERLLLEQKVST
eukprot:scaffold457790_cov55-Attheya_sp.AAC.1